MSSWIKCWDQKSNSLKFRTLSPNFFYNSNYDYAFVTYSDGDFAINFGSFFGGKTPEEFYNDKLNTFRNDYINETNNETKITKRNKYLKVLEAAKLELTQMSNILNGSTITISVIGTYTFNS